MKNDCPCKQCICLAICIGKDELVCDMLSSWYLKYYPSYHKVLRKRLEKVFGRHIPSIITENQQTHIQFSKKPRGYYE